eukprot:3364267-Pleurochrysis_carterae.AAC.1
MAHEHRHSDRVNKSFTPTALSSTVGLQPSQLPSVQQSDSVGLVKIHIYIAKYKNGTNGPGPRHGPCHGPRALPH